MVRRVKENLAGSTRRLPEIFVQPDSWFKAVDIKVVACGPKSEE